MGLFKPNIPKLKQKKNVPRLIKALSHKEKLVRESAALALGALRTNQAVDALIRTLQDPAWFVRKAAAKSLGEIRSPEAVEPLVAALKDVDVRNTAADAIVKIGGGRAVDGLLVALSDDDSYVRFCAAISLGQIRGARAAPSLFKALKDNNVNVRNSARDSLKLIGLPSDPPTRAVYAVAMQDWGQAVSLGKDAVEPLIAALNDPDSEARKGSAKSLGKIRDPRAVEPLIASLKDTEDSVSAEAAKALGEIGDSAAVQPLIAAVRDERFHSRKPAGEALAKIGLASIEALVALLSCSDSTASWTAHEALAEIGLPAQDCLISALTHDAEQVRCDAANLLGRIGSRKAFEPLVATLRDPSSGVRFSAAEALEKIGLPDDPSDLAYWAVAKGDWERALSAGSRAVDPLALGMRGGDDHLRKSAAETMVKIGMPSVKTLVSLLKDESAWLRENAVKGLGEIYSKEVLAALEKGVPREASATDRTTLKSLLTVLNDVNEQLSVRKAAANAIVKIGTPSVETLTSLLKDESAWVREDAASGIGEIYHNEVLAALEKGVSREATATDRTTLKSLLAVLNDASEQLSVRKAAANAIVKIGTPSVETLTSLLKDESAWVREDAASGIGEIYHNEVLAASKKCISRIPSSTDRMTAKSLLKVFNNATEQVSVRKAAANAVESIGLVSDPVIHVWSAMAKEKWEEVVTFGSAAVEPLISALRYDDGSVCGGAVKALGKIRDGTAVEPLIAILRNNDGRVCREAVDALDAIHDIRAVEPLIAVIADKGGSVCDNTVEALGNFGDERAVEPLVAVLTETRYSVMEALVKIGKPSVEPLIKALKSNNDFRRWDAAHVLIRLYHQGILDEEAKKRILSVRDVIYRPHTDYPETCSGPHSDVPEISL